jgi:hypothetical protein
MSYVNVVLDTLTESDHYPHADLSAAKLQALHNKTRAEQDKHYSELPPEREWEKPHEIWAKSDPLSQKIKDVAGRLHTVRQEMDRRMKGHGKMTPLPPHQRYSFYGGNLR